MEPRGAVQGRAAGEGESLTTGSAATLLVGIAIAGAVLLGAALVQPRGVPVPTAQTLYVDDDGFCGGLNVTCYRQLAEALRVSEDGDTVFVFSGRYTSASVDHAVAIIGEDRDGVVVDGRGVAG